MRSGFNWSAIMSGKDAGVRETTQRRISMIEYYTNQESFYAEGVGSFTAYGIGVREDNQSSKITLQYIPNVFLDRQKAERLAAMCNYLKLDPLHLFDVVEDAVSDL